MVTTTIRSARTGTRRGGAGRHLAALTASVGLLAAGTASAAAQPIENSHFRGSASHVEQDEGRCLEVPFPLLHEQDFNARMQIIPKGRDRFGHFSLTYVNRGVYTNTDSGATFTVTSTAREADARIVDNGDGTLTITGAMRGTTVVRAERGGVVGIDSLRTTFESVLDQNGTPDDWSDDEEVSFTQSEPVGVSTLGGFDECAMALELLS